MLAVGAGADIEVDVRVVALVLVDAVADDQQQDVLRRAVTEVMAIGGARWKTGAHAGLQDLFAGVGDERDFAFATRFALPIVEVIRPADAGTPAGPLAEAYVSKAGTDVLVNSGRFDGTPSPRAFREIHGVGDAKLERYGAAFLEVVQKHAA